MSYVYSTGEKAYIGNKSETKPPGQSGDILVEIDNDLDVRKVYKHDGSGWVLQNTVDNYGAIGEDVHDTVDLSDIRTQLGDIPNQYRSKTVKLEQADCSDTLKAQIAGTAGILSIPEDGSVTPVKTNFMQIGKNLFNKNDSGVELNTYLDSSTTYGGVANGYYRSGFIAVTPSTVYRFSGLTVNEGSYGIWYFAADKTTVVALAAMNTIVGSTNTALTTPSDAYYLRFTGLMSAIDTTQLEEGSTITSFESYGFKLKTEYVESYVGQEINTAKAEVTLDKTSNQNLLDLSTVTEGLYLASSGGFSNGTYCITDFIYVEGLEGIAVTNSLESGVYGHYFDADKAFISSFALNTGSLVRYPIISEASYIRLTLTSANKENNIVYKGYAQQMFAEHTNLVKSDLIEPRQNKIVMPPILCVAKGLDCNIFYDNLMYAPPETLKGYAEGSIGNAYKRFFKYAPVTTAEDSYLYFYGVDNNLNVVGDKRVLLKTIDTSGLSGTKNFLCVGDSFTDIGQWTKCLKENLISYGITPNFVGTDTNQAGIKCEFMTGSTLNQFVTNTGINPWWNSTSGTNDIVKYLTDNSLATPDFLIIQFTWNDIGYVKGKSYAGIIANIKTLCDAFRIANPSGEVVFSIEPSGSIKFNNYDTMLKQSTVLGLAEALFAEFYGTGTYSYVHIAPSYAWVDRLNGYNTSTVTIERIGATESYATDSVHPNNGAMYQIGDCVTSVVAAILKGNI